MNRNDQLHEATTLPDQREVDDPSALRSTLRTDLIRAMKRRQTEVVAALRTALAAIDNAEAVDTPQSDGISVSGPIAGSQSGVGSTEATRRVLSMTDVLALLSKQIDDRVAAAELYDANGQPDAANRLRREADALRPYRRT